MVLLCLDCYHSLYAKRLSALPVKVHVLLLIKRLHRLAELAVEVIRVRDEHCSLLWHFGKERLILYRIAVDLPGQILLQLELIADAKKFVLLILQDVLQDVKQSFLSEMDEAVKDLECVLVWNHVGEEAEEGVGEQGFEHDIPRLEVNVEETLSFEQPHLDIFNEGVELFHSIRVQESPLRLYDR